MIQCPNCQHQELPGALFCSECGTQLVTVDTLTAPLANHGNEYSAVDDLGFGSVPEPVKDKVSLVRDKVITLKILDSDRILHLVGRTEYTLGRVAKGQPILPEFDLSEYKAYDQGVSRLHAAIKVSQLRVSIIDLGSANGTRVNGQKIVANVEYPLKNGDVIALGKLKFEFQANSD
jgi:hypothetical protein